MREATEQEVAQAQSILSEVSYTPNSIGWGSKKSEAFAMARSVAGYMPTSTGCFACNLKVLNILRTMTGTPPIGGEASRSLRERRIKVCRGDKEDGTDACEHLAWPGLNCGKCGCFIDIKASFKSFRCPINLWPIA